MGVNNTRLHLFQLVIYNERFCFPGRASGRAEWAVTIGVRTHCNKSQIVTRDWDIPDLVCACACTCTTAIIAQQTSWKRISTGFTGTKNRQPNAQNGVSICQMPLFCWPVAADQLSFSPKLRWWSLIHVIRWRAWVSLRKPWQIVLVCQASVCSFGLNSNYCIPGLTCSCESSYLLLFTNYIIHIV